MKNKGLKIISDGFFIDVIDHRSYSMKRLFDIFEAYQDENDFGVSERYIDIARIVANMFISKEAHYKNVFRSKIRLVIA